MKYTVGLFMVGSISPCARQVPVRRPQGLCYVPQNMPGSVVVSDSIGRKTSTRRADSLFHAPLSRDFAWFAHVNSVIPVQHQKGTRRILGACVRLPASCPAWKETGPGNWTSTLSQIDDRGIDLEQVSQPLRRVQSPVNHHERPTFLRPCS